jgi:hypothetical protein
VYAAGTQKYLPARSFFGSRAQLMQALAQSRAADEVCEQL